MTPILFDADALQFKDLLPRDLLVHEVFGLLAEVYAVEMETGRLFLRTWDGESLGPFLPDNRSLDEIELPRDATRATHVIRYLP